MALMPGPSRVAVIALAGLCRAIGSALLGLVPALSVTRVLGAHPLGDAVLWQPDGVWLLETAVRAPSQVAHAVWWLAGLVCASFFLSAFPLAILVASRGPMPPATWYQAFRLAKACAVRLTLLAATVLALQSAVIAMSALLVGFGCRLFDARSLETWPFFLGGVLGAALGLGIGAVGDLARAKVVWCEEKVWRSMVAAIVVAQSRSGALCAAGVGRAFLTVLGLLASAKLVLALLPGAPLTAGLVALAAGLLPVAFRSSWFGAVGRLSGGDFARGPVDADAERLVS